MRRPWGSNVHLSDAALALNRAIFVSGRTQPRLKGGKVTGDLAQRWHSGHSSSGNLPGPTRTAGFLIWRLNYEDFCTLRFFGHCFVLIFDLILPERRELLLDFAKSLQGGRSPVLIGKFTDGSH